MKADWRVILAVGGVAAGAYVIYRLAQLKAPTVADVGTTVGSAAAEIIKLPFTVATAMGADTVGTSIGSTIFDVLNPGANSGSSTATRWEIQQKANTRRALVAAGATDMEALTVLGPWHSGMPLPTMADVLKLRGVLAIN